MSLALLFACSAVSALAVTLNADLSEMTCIDKFEETLNCVHFSVEVFT